MPKLKDLSIAAVAAMLSASAALAGTEAEDQSYLPPQGVEAQTKEPSIQVERQAERRIPGTHYGTRSHYLPWQGPNYATRGVLPFFPGIFFALFR